MGGFILTASHGQTFWSPPAKPGVYLLDYYMRLIFGEEKNIAEKFAEIDIKKIREMEKNHYPKKKIYSSRKIKKTLRSPDFKKQLLSAFQAVAN
jgi:hypothetical protein